LGWERVWAAPFARMPRRIRISALKEPLQFLRMGIKFRHLYHCFAGIHTLFGQKKVKEPYQYADVPRARGGPGTNHYRNHNL